MKKVMSILDLKVFNRQYCNSHLTSQYMPDHPLYLHNIFYYQLSMYLDDSQKHSRRTLRSYILSCYHKSTTLSVYLKAIAYVNYVFKFNFLYQAKI